MMACIKCRGKVMLATINSSLCNEVDLGIYSMVQNMYHDVYAYPTL